MRVPLCPGASRSLWTSCDAEDARPGGSRPEAHHPVLCGSWRLRVFPRSGAPPALSRLTLTPQRAATLHPHWDQSSSIRTCWREEKHAEQRAVAPPAAVHTHDTWRHRDTHTLHTRTQVHTHTGNHVHRHVYSHTYTDTDTETHTRHTNTGTHTCTHGHTRVLTHVHRYRHGNTHMTHKHGDTRTRVYTRVRTHIDMETYIRHTGTHTTHTTYVSTYTRKHVQHTDMETRIQHTDTGTHTEHTHAHGSRVCHEMETPSTGLTGQPEGSDSTTGAAPSAGPLSRPRVSVSHVILTHAAGANSSEQREWRQRECSLCLEVTRPEWAGGSSEKAWEMTARGRRPTQARTAPSAPFGSDPGWVCCMRCSESKHAWRQECRGHGGVSREGPGSNTAPSMGVSPEGRSTPDPMRGGAVCTPACTPVHTPAHPSTCSCTHACARRQTDTLPLGHTAPVP